MALELRNETHLRADRHRVPKPVGRGSATSLQYEKKKQVQIPVKGERRYKYKLDYYRRRNKRAGGPVAEMDLWIANETENREERRGNPYREQVR